MWVGVIALLLGLPWPIRLLVVIVIGYCIVESLRIAVRNQRKWTMRQRTKTERRFGTGGSYVDDDHH